MPARRLMPGEPLKRRPKAPPARRPVPRPLRLRASEQAAPGLMRLLRAEIAGAIADLARITPANAPMLVHVVRRRLKRARAIVRLIRPMLGDHAKPLATSLRAAAHALAEARDATVLADTAEAIARRVGTEEERALLLAVAQAARRSAAEHALDGATIRQAGAALDAAREQVAGLAAKGAASRHVVERLGRVYRRARKGWRAARASPDSETLHDWRRLVQDRLHLARFFKARWPEARPPQAARLDRLSEILGRDHDLAILLERLPEGADASLRLRQRIAARHARLAARALKLGGRLFRRKPGHVQACWIAAEGSAAP